MRPLFSPGSGAVKSKRSLDDNWQGLGKDQSSTVRGSVLVEAINAAHDVTVDFRRMETMDNYINAVVPYWNVSIEGSDRFGQGCPWGGGLWQVDRWSWRALRSSPGRAAL